MRPGPLCRPAVMTGAARGLGAGMARRLRCPAGAGGGGADEDGGCATRSGRPLGGSSTSAMPPRWRRRPHGRGPGSPSMMIGSAGIVQGRQCGDQQRLWQPGRGWAVPGLRFARVEPSRRGQRGGHRGDGTRLPARLAPHPGYYLQASSLAVLAPAPLMSAYCASKTGAGRRRPHLRARQVLGDSVKERALKVLAHIDPDLCTHRPGRCRRVPAPASCRKAVDVTDIDVEPTRGGDHRVQGLLNC
jgi:hypothetical protein